MVQEWSTSRSSSMLGLKGLLALTQLDPGTDAFKMAGSHSDSDDFRDFAKWALKRKNSDDRDGVIRFEANEASADIDVCIYDAQTWTLKQRVSPLGVMNGLMELEPSEEIDAPLTSFYIDIHV